MKREELIKNAKPILFNTEMVKAVLDGRKSQFRDAVLFDYEEYDYNLKYNFGATINELDNSLPTGMTKCENYGMSFGCDGDCPELRKGKCEVLIENSQYVINEFSKYKVNDILYVREPSVVTSYERITNIMDFRYVTDNKINTVCVPERFIELDKYDGKAISTYEANRKWIRNCQVVPNGCIKEMARIFLKVTSVRVERLQDIKIEDFLNEGINDKGFVIEKPSNSLNEYYEYLKDRWVNLWNSTAIDGYKWEDNPYVFVYEFERVD